MKRVLAIWLPNWPVQRVAAARPELAGQPLLLHAAARRGECVTACSAAAMRAGVEPGMPVAEATALMGRAAVGPRARASGSDACHSEAHDPAADRAALVALAQWCHQFSPTVGLEECEPPTAPETLLLDATNLAPLYGSEAALVAKVARALRRRGLEARLGVGDSIGAAWAAARFGGDSREGNARAEPDPRAEPGAETQWRAEALRLPGETLATLADLGLGTVASILALDREQLRSRFGPLLLTRIDQYLGRAPETISAVDPPQQFAVSESLEHPLRSGEAVRWALEQLLERVAWLLAARQVGALEIACRLHGERAATVEWSIGLFRPTASARHLLEMADMTLERLRLSAPIETIELEVVRHAPLVPRQSALFDEDCTLEGSRLLGALVDRLAARLGASAVVRCRLQHDAQPELAWREEPLVGAALARGAKARRSAARKPAGVLDRPLCVLARATPLAASSVVPDGPPIRFRRGGAQHVVARHWGPERIETGWWRRQRAVRDYYRVETTAGRRFWLFRRRRDNQWFLHAAYE